MRIRQRLALLSSIPTAARSDLQLRRSEAAPPPDQRSDQGVAIHSINNGRVLPKNEEKMKQKEIEDETLEAKESPDKNDIIRRIVNICDGGEGFNTCTPKSQSFSLQESCSEEEYKVVPLKKRRGSFERSPNEERVMSARMKSKTNKKCGDHDIAQLDHQKPLMEENGMKSCSSGGGKKGKRGNVIMEGSRCSRVNGRGWRCCHPTLVGYSLCEHHLGKGRLRGGGGGGGGAPQPLMVVTKKRTKVGVVKARSMSSLLSQI